MSGPLTPGPATPRGMSRWVPDQARDDAKDAASRRWVGPARGGPRGRPAHERRDGLVARACLGSAVLPAVPAVLIAWAGYGSGAAADAALIAVSSPVLLGVVGFGVTLAVALSRSGLEPRSDPVRGPVDELGTPPPVPHRAEPDGPLGAGGAGGPVELSGPVRQGPPTSTVRERLRWSALAALVEIAVLAAAVVLDGGVAAGSTSFLHSMDDGTAASTFVLLLVEAGLIDLRAPVAFGVAWLVLARAQRPVRTRGRRQSRRPPGARTTRRCRVRRLG